MKTLTLLSIPTVFLIISFATFAGEDNPLCQVLRQSPTKEPFLADLSTRDIANLAKTCRDARAAVADELKKRHYAYAVANTVHVNCSRQRANFSTHEDFRQYVLNEIERIAEENQGKGIKLNLADNRLGLETDSSFLGNLINAIADKVGQMHTILVELDLSYNQLTELPDSIGNLSNLQVLSLHLNKLTGLPNTIGNLINLQVLKLGRNKLAGLPDSIGNLVNLQELWLDDNRLTGLPDSIGNLRNLQQLYLHYNQLTHLPGTFGNLVNLQSLLLGHNQLAVLPESIGNLRKLQHLGLSSNQLTKLPDSIGDLVNLQQLVLYNNQLTLLPNSVGNLTNLQSLWLDNNRLTVLPDSIGNLVNLQELALGRNPIQQETNAELHLPEKVTVHWQ
jgi:hypothetical protein